jgi:hypothetical protein
MAFSSDIAELGDDGAERGPLGSPRRRGPGDEAHGKLADAGVMKAVVAILALSRPPPDQPL